MEQTFTGKITEIRNPRTGTGQKGEWANAEFEVTESNPQNNDYPQIALFDFFKNGEYLKYAKDFETYYKLGDIVTVHFNFKANEYTNAKGENVKFYKTYAWKIEKLEKGVEPPFEPATDINDDEPDDLPF
tara:strand:- start:288 stop:677 length:390 start_codon:yes stop_codon:yes gene_type:complete